MLEHFISIGRFIGKDQSIMNSVYLLNRDIKFQLNILKKIFKKKVSLKYNEILFHPELNLFFGNKDSLISRLDSKLSGFSILKYFARQVLIKVQK